MKDGLLDIIEHLHAQGFNVVISNAALCAATHGHLHVLKFYLALHRPDMETSNICFMAAVNGHLDCLQHVGELGLLPAEETACTSVLAQVSKLGHLEVVKYLHNLGIPLDGHIFNCAASSGNLPMVQYMHEQGGELNVELSTHAACSCHVDILRYLHEHSCPWDTESIFKVTATCGRCACLKYLLDNGVQVDTAAALESAVLCNHPQVLQFLHEYGFPLHAALCRLALQHVHLACLKYLCEHGCEWGDTTTDIAATEGNLRSLAFPTNTAVPGGLIRAILLLLTATSPFCSTRTSTLVRGMLLHTPMVIMCSEMRGVAPILRNSWPYWQPRGGRM